MTPIEEYWNLLRDIRLGGVPAVNKVETHYRLLIERESIEATLGRLLVIADSVTNDRHLRELERVCYHLREACYVLRDTPSLLSLREQLELSIAVVKEGKKA